MKEVVFCFIEPECWNWGINDIAEENGFVPLNTFFREFFRNEGFGDREIFLQIKDYVDNGIIVPTDLVLKVCMIGIEPHLHENLFFSNVIKYVELMQMLKKEGYKLKHICYIYHETLDILLEEYKQKGQGDIGENLEYKILKQRIYWQETIFDAMPYPLVRIGYDLRNFEEFKENVKGLFI